MKKVCWPYFDPEFDTLPERINGPSCRVCIDNESSEDSTVIKVDSVNKQDLLLEVVQIITDLNLSITKGYISSDAGWFMDVFHVKDEQGNKLMDKTVLHNIQQAIGGGRNSSMSGKTSETKTKAGSLTEHAAIEMTATDRPGLFSEISAALADLHCNIVEAHAWSHNARLACVAYISDHSSLTPILHDPLRLASIEQHLNMVLRATPPLAGDTMKQQEVKTADVVGTETTTITNVERRLHQLMLSGRDFDMPHSEPSTSPRSPLEGSQSLDHDITKAAIVSIESCYQKGYSIVNVECKDRSRVMFDTLCTLIDMEYVIFHASVSCQDGYAFQEYFIRHRDGSPLCTESEKDRVSKCLEAAIERRVCEGVKLELCANNRVGLLSDITRVLRENGLAVVRADIATEGEKAINAFYLRDVSGKKVDMEFVESVKKEMSPISVQVKNEETVRAGSPERYHFSLADMLKSQLDRFSNSVLL
ncbi:ACT domain-containing protein ACR2 [Silene latifolia]|uniref:ACT domain-containing protein ACR2 n=1 Tax=Silene latifolia TaxID=37657 RepID=UPI003D775D03